MKCNVFLLLVLAVGVCVAGEAAGQPTLQEILAQSRGGHVTRVKDIDEEGRIFEMGSGIVVAPTDEMSEAERLRIMSAIEENRSRLIAEGKLSRTYEKTITNFAWPLRQAAGRTDFDFHGISAFVDENPANPNQLLDYNCGARTYDIAGYDHRGTDIFSWPFGWKKMDDEDVVIAAGAPGTIIQKSDGNSDRNCAMNNLTWNAVYVQHADGSVAWYGHMKNGSTTLKKVGESVVAGEYLGVVGSSGSSTGPHLHLELYDASNALVDPWLGPCNSKSKQITWAQQLPYRDTGVNALTIGTAAPLVPACPTAETSYATDYVTPGTTVYFTAYVRDQTVSTSLGIRLLRPDGSVYASRSSTASASDYNVVYYYWSFGAFPSVAGTWTFEATIAGRTYTKTFQVGGAPAYGASASIVAMAGSAQSTTPGAAFPAPLRLLVTDLQGRAVKDARISLAAPSSGATAVLESRTAVTDTSGVALVSALANATAGSYSVTATVPGVATGAVIALQNTATTIPPRLGNISTRMQVLTGNDVMIGGFVIGGSVPKTVVVRARGPSLIPFGIANALANPVLQLFAGQTLIATNDDWPSASNAVTLQASGFAPSDALESAIYTTLSPGAYTAIVSGSGGATGVGIVEVFEVDHPEIPLVNISTRGQVLTGNDVMIGGFIIQGSAPQTVVIRARGPSLVPFGIANAMANPTLQVYSGATLIASNDDWGSASNAAAITASGFAPSNALESAILITLNPGAYTAIVTGSAGGTGVGIVEVFAQ